MKVGKKKKKGKVAVEVETHFRTVGAVYCHLHANIAITYLARFHLYIHLYIYLSINLYLCYPCLTKPRYHFQVYNKHYLNIYICLHRGDICVWKQSRNVQLSKMTSLTIVTVASGLNFLFFIDARIFVCWALMTNTSSSFQTKPSVAYDSHLKQVYLSE